MRNAYLLLPGALCAVLVTAAAQAATVIETHAGPERARSVMTVDKGKARIQSEPGNYILIDPASGQYLYILPASREIVKMNSAPPVEPGGKKNRPPVAGKLVHKGAGPRIAGFPTQRYQLFAKGELCVNAYLSREAMQRGQLKEFLAGFHQLQAKQKQEYRAVGTQYAPCDDAQETLMGRYPELGLAMRTVGADGQLLQEVTRMQTGVVVTDSFLQAPEGFKQLTHDEFIRKMEAGDGGQEVPPAKEPGGKS